MLKNMSFICMFTIMMKVEQNC